MWQRALGERGFEAEMNAVILLLARVMIAGLFIWDAWLMVTEWEPTVAYMEQFGVPGALLPLAALFQFFGGLAIVAGTQRRHQGPYIETMRRIHDGAIGDLVGGQCYWNQGGLWVHKR